MNDDTHHVWRKSTLAEQGVGDDLSTYVVPDVFVELTAAAIRTAESYEKRIIRGGSLAGTSVDAVESEECRFASTDLSKIRWQNLRLRDVRLEKCDLANACWSKATLEKVEMKKCRGTGLQLLDANCGDTVFEGCKFHLSAFHGSKFRNCRWENCDLREADFEGVELLDVVFRNCDLRAARFPNCSSNNVDFRGSHLAGMQFDAAKLRGTRVEPSQLTDMAELFGLIVEPLDEE